MEINIERLKSTLLDLSRIGFNEADKGIYRTSFSEADMAARRWLMQTLETEGFQTEMDGAGNVYGRLGANGKPTVTVGSHLDTVPAGGMFDGALGVVASLEIVRRVKESNLELMPSGAGDTQFMTEITRAGMFFVPSIGSVSHSPDEWTHWDDLESGANLLLNAAIELATEDQA